MMVWIKDRIVLQPEVRPVRPLRDHSVPGEYETYGHASKTNCPGVVKYPVLKFI